ncbi:hypothetical protein FRX31_022012 [Thalictrum thalictroides]|uniref:Ribosomal protein S1 n=1 Tax=Thalictrum thalictroides TaxID=46969 RepID=A0A7J6VVI1_THATH|nr:hypothetical protein FRX31_022012 [Thalictrum thalictroides]
MSIYMSRLFPKSNSSFLLQSGNALKSTVLRLKEDTYLVDAGPGTPRICMGKELTRIPISKTKSSRFETKVGIGSTNVTNSEESAIVKKSVMERMFVDLHAGDSRSKEQAAIRFQSLVSGYTDVVSGEPIELILPKRFRQKQAWIELNMAWRRRDTKLNGIVVDRVRGGYAVAIAGYITFLPLRYKPKLGLGKFFIEEIKRNNIIVGIL